MQLIYTPARPDNPKNAVVEICQIGNYTVIKLIDYSWRKHEIHNNAVC